MQLLPAQQEILAPARRTGAIRNGHLLFTNGPHCDQQLEIALLLRDFTHTKSLSMARSRRLRENRCGPNASGACPIRPDLG